MALRRPSGEYHVNRKSAMTFLAAAAALLVACPGEQAPSSAGRVENLLPLASWSATVGETGAVNLSTPYATWYIPRGWTHPYDLTDPARTLITPTGPEAILRFNVFMPHDRWLLFNASTHGIRGNLPNQEMEVWFAGESLGTISFGPEEKQYRLYIPSRLQKTGANELTLRFSVLQRNPDWLGNRDRHHDYPFPYVCGYFSDLKFHFGDENGPFPYVAADETEAIKPSGHGDSLSQLARSTMDIAVDLPEGAVLGVEGIVQSPTGDTENITLTIAARSDGEGEYTPLWSQKYAIGNGTASVRFEESLDLGDRAGSPQLLRFQVDSGNWLPQSAAIWRRMEVRSPAANAAPAPEVPATAAKKPRNVVIIILDALRADYVGSYGGNAEATPNLDALAAEAVRFENPIVTAPYTICSISSLFSGLLPETHGVRKISQVFPKGLENMPLAFRRSGFYTIALAGTQFLMPKYGLSRSFETVIPLRNDGFKSEQVTTMDTEAMARGVRMAVESGKPFFLYAHLLPPHWPYNPPAPYNTFFISGREPQVQKAWQVKSLLEVGLMQPDDEDLAIYQMLYRNNLRYADECVRQMIGMLKEQGVWEDTLFIVTSDHGESLGEHREFGHTTNVFEQTARVPLIVRFPGVAPRVVSQQVGLIDFFPTFAELFTLKVEKVRFQGRSIVPLLSGGEMQPADYYYTRAYSPKLIFSARGERYKYVSHDFAEFYFDLQADPEERNNLIDRFAASAGIMRLKALRAAATGSSADEEEVKLTREEEEDLKNLGYIQ